MPLGVPLAGCPHQRPGAGAASGLTPGKTVGERPSNIASFGDYFTLRGTAFDNCLYTQRPNRSLCLTIVNARSTWEALGGSTALRCAARVDGFLTPVTLFPRNEKKGPLNKHSGLNKKVGE